jgi:hypothetical protein
VSRLAGRVSLSRAMRYEEWADDEGCVLLPDDDKKQRQLAVAVVGRAQLVWSVEADSWEEACTAWHEHKRWEPYVPMDLLSEPPET